MGLLKKTSILLLLLILCLGCKKDEHNFTELFDNLPSYHLQGRKMNIDPLMVWAFEFNDDFMVVRGSGSEYFYHLYDINTGEKIQDLLKVGNGPNEANMAMDFVLTAHNKMYLSTSNGRNELFVYDLTNASPQIPILPKEITKMDSLSSQLSLSRLYISSDSVLIGRPNYNKDGRNKMLYISDLKTKKDKFYVNFPSSECNDQINPVALSAIYQGDLCLSDDQKTIALTSTGAEYLSFYHREETDLELNKEYFFTPAFFKSTSDNWYTNSSDKSYVYMTDLSTSGDKLYALYYGVPYSEYSNMLNGKKENSGIIYVFDLLGTPLYSIKIHKPKAFINVRGNKLIALTVGDDLEDCFYVYDLSGIPK